MKTLGERSRYYAVQRRRLPQSFGYTAFHVLPEAMGTDPYRAAVGR